LEIRGGFKFRNSQLSLSSYSSNLCISPINTYNLKGKRERTHVQKLKAQRKKEFDMKDLGEAKKIFGRDIT